LRYTDEQLLKMVAEERKRSIGFGEGDGGTLTAARERALAYYKGEMADVLSLPNRSSVTDSAVADAIETVLPDVMEVFVGGEDVATFVPLGEDDENAAQEETDFVQHVVFTENEGFLNLYTAIKDSLLTRTGLIHWWWEENEKTETVAQTDAEMAPILQQVAEMGGQALEAEETEGGGVSLTSTKLHGKVCIRAVPSEDFTIAPDTVSLRDATYCAMRDRPRVQDLIARGIDPEKARALKTYGSPNGEEIKERRDYADENERSADETLGDLRVVEVRAHFIRLASDDGGKLKVWRVITDGEEKVLLDKDEVDGIHFAGFTPYIVPHRFYGESVADKLIEVQRIKTVLLRNHLDSIYFALNQRMEVADSGAGEFTISDLLRNEPGVPIRVKTPGTINPVSAGALNVDTLASLEYAATMAEGRSGIVRNAQGLNPDTLHDTAKGAMALIAAAQKRVRMIARIFAETGVKDLFIGVHCMLRNAYGAEGKNYETPSAKLRNKWVSAEPNNWKARCAMTVHVGVGSAGREQDLLVSGQRLEVMERLIALQQGVQGPFVDPANVHNALSAWERSTGTKNPEQYWSDPKTAPPQPPKPDPEMEKAKAELALKQQEGQAKLQLQAQEGQVKSQLEEQRAIREHELAMAKLEAEMALKREQIGAELQLKREQLTAELQLKRELGFAQAATSYETGMAKVEASTATSQVKPGGNAG
jgi:hypothetical protein